MRASAEEARAVHDVGLVGEERRDEVAVLDRVVLEVGVLDDDVRGVGSRVPSVEPSSTITSSCV
jgi:hypothetical protein